VFVCCYLGDAEDRGDGVDGEDKVGELDAEEAHEERRGEALAVALLGGWGGGRLGCGMEWAIDV
jgi:hypothetical protein